MPADLLTRKSTHFVLWRPGVTDPAPVLLITTDPRHGPDDVRQIALQPSPDFPDLWELAATDCELDDGKVYWYWFRVRDTDPYNPEQQVVACTDPTAWTVDRRYSGPAWGREDGGTAAKAAGVVLFKNGHLVPCDPGGETADWAGDPQPNDLPTNNQLVIYELPVRWVHAKRQDGITVGNGTFRDVLALLEPEAPAATPPENPALRQRAHLVELGVTALELVPPADSDDTLNWGYGTANYFAADFDLGRPGRKRTPTASTDLVALIKCCHQQGLRVICDVVMAFARNCSYRQINFLDFFVQFGSGDPEEAGRDGFGGDLWKYDYWTEGYHPISGKNEHLVPARAFMLAYLTHWMEYYRIDGLRLDSVNNINNYDFLQEYTNHARALWAARGGSDDRFLVVGEELSMPMELVTQKRLDGLWNERFKSIARQVILGREEPGQSFEESVYTLIDCRRMGFADGSEAINYLTSHDIGGPGNERLYNWLLNNGVADAEPRIKLAFACLLTAVGVPMILAGEEFADGQNVDPAQPEQIETLKQVDPVNYERLREDWRERIFVYVSRLVHLRASAPALMINDTEFIHVDIEGDRRVLAWRRGQGADLVVVVANFSDYATPDAGNGEADYVIPGWPETPPGTHWWEVTQDRGVAREWAGREPIYAWEAKVYAQVPGDPA